jgi:DNA-directed RNA polymerase, omega subunit
MISKPTMNELLGKIDSRYTLVIATSKRARQIAQGSMPLTKVKSESKVTLAANEIAEGKVMLKECAKSEETGEVE